MAIKNNTTWKNFEKIVANLLSLSGFNVIKEILIGSKKVDLYAEKNDLGKKRRYAIECKYYEKVLDRNRVVHILADYTSLYDANLIDVILLVTKNGLTVGAQTLVQENRLLNHLSIDELRFSLIDFRGYLSDIKNQYCQEGLDRYYVPTRKLKIDIYKDEPDDLETFINNWLSKETSQPLAIMAGYGIGKSTFLRHIANKFAKEFECDKSKRIPILIPLSEICSEQTIEGLLGRHFTSIHQVPGYNFNLFSELNNSGCFILLLDGFDEMKHSMTSAIFHYTFKEVLKIVSPNSKVIITGRPTAFLNNEERCQLLHGMNIYGLRKAKIVGRPDFLEIEIAPFMIDQIKFFIQKYRKYLESYPILNQRIPEESDFLKSKVLIDISTRPIQLRMLFDVLPAYPGNVDELTIRELYSFFVDLILKREEEKPARKKYSAKQRKLFLEALAFFMLYKGIQKISIDDIPFEYLEIFFNIEDNLDDIKREFTVGALLEGQYPGKVFFPHRSIQEFLISEFILSFFRGNKQSYEFCNKLNIKLNFTFIEEYLTPEIIDFMVVTSGRTERKQAFIILKNQNQALTINTLRYWLDTDSSISEIVEEAKQLEVWALALLVIGKIYKNWFQSAGDKEKFYNLALCFFDSTETRTKSNFYQAWFLCWILFSSEKNIEKRNKLFETMCIKLLSFVLRHIPGNSGKKINGYARPGYTIELINYAAPIIINKKKQKNSVDITNTADNFLEKDYYFSLDKMKSHLLKECNVKIGLKQWYSDHGQNALSKEGQNLCIFKELKCSKKMITEIKKFRDVEFKSTYK